MAAIDFDEDKTSDGNPPRRLPPVLELSFLFLSGPHRGQVARISNEGGTIGRRVGATVRINDPQVSRCHAEVEYRHGAFRIRDLGSNFGVFVEEARVEEYDLQDGDRIQFSSNTIARVRYQDATEAALLEQLQFSASKDPQTSLVNRQHLLERLEEELSFARRHKVPFTVLLLGIDHLKKINMQFGDIAGDEIIKNLAAVIKEATRREDIVARYSGDEFVVVSRNDGEASGVKLAERLRKAVARCETKLDSQKQSMTVSVGVASYIPSDAQQTPSTVAGLIARADCALYGSKRSGRNRTTGWSSIAGDSDQTADVESSDCAITLA